MLPFDFSHTEYSRAARLIGEMERLHRVAGRLKPTPPLKRSDIGLLGALLHFENRGISPVNVSRLAGVMHQSLPATSQKLRLLEEQGYTLRKNDDSDRRVAYIELTGKGRQAAHANLDRMLGRVEGALEMLGDKDAETLVRLMGLLGAAVEEMTEADMEKMEEGEDNC